MDKKSYEQLKLALIINYYFDKITIIFVTQSIIFSFYWMRGAGMMPNCALYRRTILCLYIPGFQSEVFKLNKILSERLKRMKEQKKDKRSVLVSESAYSSQNTQFGLVMVLF